LGKYDE
jgi:hypothetical protein